MLNIKQNFFLGVLIEINKKNVYNISVYKDYVIV